jgi:hypothetical protein
MEYVATPMFGFPEETFGLEGFDMTVQLMNQLVFAL